MPLPATARIAVSVRTAAAHADVVALLLDGNGHADGDDGVVLFSHPVTAAGAVVLKGDTVTIELAKLPGAVQRVLVVAQADGVTDMTACGATTAVVSGDGTEAARFELPAPPAMPTVQLVEIYRRDGAWKARALGDGYEAGLARLLAVHGVEVTDDPVEQEGPPPAPAWPGSM